MRYGQQGGGAGGAVGGPARHGAVIVPEGKIATGMVLMLVNMACSLVLPASSKYKTFAEKALAQVPDEDWFRRIDSESNSLALVVKHLAGNMRSRWRDFLTSDGEKPDRKRDTEFEDPPATRAAHCLEPIRWPARAR